MTTATASRPATARRTTSTTTAPRPARAASRHDEVLLTVEGRAMLAERARYLREVALPDPERIIAGSGAMPASVSASRQPASRSIA